MPPRVLIVDDNVEVADAFAEFFGKRGYRTAVAHCGVTGLAMARATRPDVVLLNLQMPWMNGLEVLRELRGDPATAGLKVIMTSGYVDIPELAAQAGAQDAILYPARFDEVQRKVERLLERRH
ncbi:MAG: response regulator [Elusimicrobia bacterium]|nr:response regulator [Elusimicrobiota bacterium]